MNNNFVVTIPKELKTIKSKLFFGLTKRQLIGFSLAITLGVPVFLLIKNASIDIAMYSLFFVAMPILFCTMYQKNGMVAETWIKLFLEYKYLYENKRTYAVTKKNLKLAKERKMISNVKKKKLVSTPSSAS